MTDRCEPPPELRGVNGWHWVRKNERPPVIAQWDGAIWMHTRMPLGLEDCAKAGWRYIAPVSTPAEVEALRAELRRCETACFDVQRDNITLRARVAELEGALEPFAVIADEAFTAARDSQTVTDIGMEDEVTVGMLRTARAALSPTQSPEKSG